MTTEYSPTSIYNTLFFYKEHTSIVFSSFVLSADITPRPLKREILLFTSVFSHRFALFSIKNKGGYIDSTCSPTYIYNSMMTQNYLVIGRVNYYYLILISIMFFTTAQVDSQDWSRFLLKG